MSRAIDYCGNCGDEVLDGYCPKCSPPPAPELITKESALKAIEADMLRMVGYGSWIDGLKQAHYIIQSLPPVALSICADCNSTIYSNRPIEGVPPVVDERVTKCIGMLQRCRKWFDLEHSDDDEQMELALEIVEAIEHLLSELNQGKV